LHPHQIPSDDDDYHPIGMPYSMKPGDVLIGGFGRKEGDEFNGEQLNLEVRTKMRILTMSFEKEKKKKFLFFLLFFFFFFVVCGFVCLRH
jgi:hypothetical protein